MNVAIMQSEAEMDVAIVQSELKIPIMRSISDGETMVGERSLAPLAFGDWLNAHNISVFAKAGYTGLSGVRAKSPVVKEMKPPQEYNAGETCLYAYNPTTKQYRAIDEPGDATSDEAVIRGHSYTEDRSLLLAITSKDGVPCKFFGIFDGHGGTPEFSELCASYARRFIRKNPISRDTNIKEYLADLVRSLHLEAIKQLSGVHGGTTLNITIVFGNVMYVAILGDSPTIVIRPIDGKYDIVFKTADHDVDNVVEKERLTAKRIRIEWPYMVSPVNSDNKLMTTRAVGDWDHEYGLSREPDIYELELKDGDIVLISSDGLYEIWELETRTFRGQVEKRLPYIVDCVAKNADNISNLAEALILNQVEQVADIYSEYVSRLKAKNMPAFHAMVRKAPFAETVAKFAEQFTQEGDNQMVMAFQFNSVRPHLDNFARSHSI